MRGAKLIGFGASLPEKILTNADLEGLMDTTDEWVTERTGIRQRHVGGTTSGLAIEAAAEAIESAGCNPSDIDLLLLATTSPDQTCPGTAPTVQAELGLTCGAVDLQAACSGWVYGLVTAHSFVQQGMDNILIVGAESLSRITDYTQRDTGILFGDGAGAGVLQACDGPGELLAWELGSDGTGRHALYADPGQMLVMDGKEVFRRAVRIVVDTAKRTLDKAGLTVDDVDLVIPHQANVRIIEAANKRLGLSMDDTVIILDRTGNTSAATIPLCIHDALANDRIHDGDIVLLLGFGAGMTWASAALRWGG